MLDFRNTVLPTRVQGRAYPLRCAANMLQIMILQKSASHCKHCVGSFCAV